MENILTRLIELPCSVRGLTCKDDQDDYNIYINARLSYEQQQDAFKHEMGHIKRGHFYSNESVEEKEISNAKTSER